MNRVARVLLCLLLLLGAAGRADAIIFLETADPSHHTSTPGDNSGWQYEGKFNNYLGVPIAPHFFITAKHIGGSVGNVLNFHGDLYTTIAAYVSPDADLRIWEVDHSKPFPTYAPLSSGAADIGGVAEVFGRGTQRGVDLMVSSELRGWEWGTADHVERWGRNVVTGTVAGGAGFGELLYCDFNSPGIPGECHLSVGDSGGGLFVLEDGLWRLAGINYAVDGPFRTSATGTSFNAAVFDARGLWIRGPAHGVDGNFGRPTGPFGLLLHAHFEVADVDFRDRGRGDVIGNGRLPGVAEALFFTFGNRDTFHHWSSGGL